MQLNNNREEYLSFERIIDRGANIFEIIAHPDMEINTGHLKEINDFISEQPAGNDSAILINRKHSYHNLPDMKTNRLSPGVCHRP